MKTLYAAIKDSDLRNVNAMKEVEAAIVNTPRDYYQKLVSTRSAKSENNSGSVVELQEGIPSTPEEVEQAISEAQWVEFVHINLLPGTEGYVTYDLGGQVGIVPLDIMPKECVLEVTDQKDTGYASLSINDSDVPEGILEVCNYSDHVVMILGPLDEEDPDKGKCVWTFHPGDPITPSMKVVGSLPSKVSVGQALKLGFKFAKLTRDVEG